MKKSTIAGTGLSTGVLLIALSLAGPPPRPR